ncbi:MAG: hypothetical protein F4017_06780 [Acidimicrobiaceae bacterium]|nr:hypothetical protein [Acidimicrobiaceae bacterium]MYH43663.1 hypothetical protein [Acidimicrobiaceae bacterium]MYJ41537.1 hypothetical protein [Acidimicrobiaceae bacterium]MYJ80895.1 hypothetical protein [Acidimicrobiaceae bacterium]MYK74281.1 hypothetical protein [Acidimicrobiaceae bacterium]
MKAPATTPWRGFRAAALALILLAAACSGSDEGPATTASETAGTAEMQHDQEMSDMAGGSHHDHGGSIEVAEGVPVPTIEIEVTEDPVEGWNLRVLTTDFRIAPENVSTAHVDGEGHMHLYIDGEKVSRLYGEWHHIGPLAPGEHEVRVELSANDHSAMAVDGDIIDATAVIVAPGMDDHAMVHDHEASTDDPHDHDHDHGPAGEPTRYDADLADADQTITVDVGGGAPVGGVRRIEVDLGSVVALMVTSDIAEEVHVHGYDILRSVSEGHPARFAFTAEIPGVFEVEFEGSGRLLLQLEIS